LASAAAHPCGLCFACASNEADGPELGVQQQPLIVFSADGCEYNNSDPESLKAYADKCDLATGVTVPNFNCNDGSDVPTTNLTPPNAVYPAGTCDRPNVLNGHCDPGSKFQVLERTADAVIVAHCRKKGGVIGPTGKWADIAVIQYNNKNGATCFYQSAFQAGGPSAPPTLPSAVTRPGEPGINTFPWLTPTATANEKCVKCHDNGPFVRSPYLAQLRTNLSGTKGGNWLPGTRVGPSVWETNSLGYLNDPQLPYKFVGNDFQSWKAYTVTRVGSSCTDCHRLGMSEIAGALLLNEGTAQRFGPIATALTQSSKNPHGATSPIWMKPGQNTFDALVETEAKGYKDCAEQFRKQQNVPGFYMEPNCRVARFAQGDTCKSSPNSEVVNGATQAPLTGDLDITSGDPGPCPPNGCKPGFKAFTSLHGPFFQQTSAPLDAPDFRGSGARLYVNSNGRWLSRFIKKNENGVAAPGGEIANIFYDELFGVTVPTGYTSAFGNFADLTGTQTSANVILTSNTSLAVLTGLIGNVSQMRSTTSDYDYARLGSFNNFMRIQHSHTATPNTGPVPSLVAGPLQSEAYRATMAAPNVQPTYLVQNQLVTGDSLLVAYPASLKARCFITGVAGAWSSSRSNNTVQPYAKIKTGTGGELRMEVLGILNDYDKVYAYASCVKLK
jgi:hypothetical protein